ncbi:hypothetical protein [Comamonas terrigena]|uniref:hypothetical protein n=1 Tax=Comamonas terrigena TaxID=32013 RepID=UPI0028AA7421|nr:hypothetical protein [Comamonas terrigena]
MKYFDDYDYKIKEIFEFSFEQRKDEKILPWEIASFVNDYNTIYYKNDLLDSISSAILNGNNPEDIIIYDGSLPLNKKYSQLDLIDESEAAKYFYTVGKPYSIIPNRTTQEIQTIYSIFSKVNSLLYSRKFRPLVTFYLIESLKKLAALSILEAIRYIVETAVKTSEEHYKKYPNSKSIRDPLTEDLIREKIEPVLKGHEASINRVDYISRIDDAGKIKILTSQKKQDKEIKSDLLKFFEIFKKVNRPVVCLRVGDNKIRILARALVNKTANGSLILRSTKKNSPLVAIFEGMATAYKTFVETSHKNELHEINKAILNEDLRAATYRAETERIKLKKEYSASINSQNIDINAIGKLPISSSQQRLLVAYGDNQMAAAALYREHGMSYVKDSFKHLDESA